MNKREDMKEILIEEAELQSRIKELGKEITRDYKDKKDIICIGILKGCFVFVADIIRELKDLDICVDFMIVSSYGEETVSSGKIDIKKDISVDIKGKDVLILEDIIDSGITLKALVDIFKKREPASVKICSLLNKESNRVVPIKGDYIGFEVPDAFVVGYGLDYAEKYRELPYVGVLKEEVYS